MIRAKQTLFGSLNIATKQIEPVTQEKNVTPTIEVQEVTPDDGYNGLSKVTIHAVTSDIDKNIKANNIKIGAEILGVSGSVIELIAEEKVIVPSKEEQVILPSEDKNAISKVTIGAVTSAIDENITPDNIRNGVEILGVKGTVSGAEKITSGKYMFYMSARLEQLNYFLSLLSGTINDASGMFHSSGKLTDVDLSNFDVSNVTDMSNMFYQCSVLTEVNLTNFNTSKVTKMNHMFYGCEKLTSLDLSSFDTRRVTAMQNMFHNCRVLKYLDIRNFDFSSLSGSYYYSSMFHNVPVDCEIIVKDDTAKSFITTNYPTLTNVKTVAEL